MERDIDTETQGSTVVTTAPDDGPGQEVGGLGSVAVLVVLVVAVDALGVVHLLRRGRHLPQPRPNRSPLARDTTQSIASTAEPDRSSEDGVERSNQLLTIGKPRSHICLQSYLSALFSAVRVAAINFMY